MGSVEKRSSISTTRSLKTWMLVQSIWACLCSLLLDFHLSYSSWLFSSTAYSSDNQKSAYFYTADIFHMTFLKSTASHSMAVFHFQRVSFVLWSHYRFSFLTSSWFVCNFDLLIWPSHFLICLWIDPYLMWVYLISCFASRCWSACSNRKVCWSCMHFALKTFLSWNEFDLVR